MGHERRTPRAEARRWSGLGSSAVFDAPTLLSYLAAAMLLVIAPGPGQMLVLARTLASGRAVGVATALGLGVGSLVHTLAAAFGLSQLLARSASLYALVQYLGAGYLVFLGVRAFRARAEVPATTPEGGGRGFPKAVARGAVTGILNPKVALFFLAFLPQFVRPERGHVILQFAVLGLLFSFLAVLGDTTVAVAAGSVSRALRRHAAWAAWRERVVGAVLVGLGLRLAFARRA
jgi:threonine/homoserine/homoserine lactone efflux protein